MKDAVADGVDRAELGGMSAERRSQAVFEVLDDQGTAGAATLLIYGGQNRIRRANPFDGDRGACQQP